MSLSRDWLRQCAGVLILMFLIWAFLNTPDDRGWYVALSALLALAAFGCAVWLIADNFIGAVKPQTEKLLKIAGCLIVGLLLLWIIGQWDSGSTATWLASAIALKLKKPVRPERAAAFLEWMRFGFRWILIPLIIIPVVARLAGAGAVRYRRFLPRYLAVFILGAVVPHYLVHWVPKLSAFGAQLTSASLRFLLAFLLMITAWVLLGRSVRGELRT